jgi:hypothetical protein
MNTAWIFSPSQLLTWRDCPRKWAFEKVAKLPKPEAASAALGTDGHTQLETYLAGGDIDFTRPSGAIVAAGLHLLPPPKSPGLLIETTFNYKSPAGYSYSGRLDMQGPDSGIFPAEGTEGLGGRPFVSDHKTTSGIAWAKTSEDLRTDPQGVLYGIATMDKYRADSVDLIWTYYQTKGPKKAKRVHLRLLRGQAEEGIRQIDLDASAIAHNLDLGLDAKAYQPNPKACTKYGGCPYVGPCGLSPRDSLQSLFADSRPEQPEPLEGNTMSLLDRLKSEPSATVETVKASDIESPADLPPGINPPEALLPPPAAAPAVSMDEAPTVAETPAKKRGRPAKAAATEAPLLTVVGKKAADTIPAPPPQDAKLFGTLYVDCIPLGGDVVQFHDILSAAKELIRVQDGKQDYRFGTFGEAAGLLSMRVLEVIKAGVEAGDAIVMQSGTPEGAHCLAALQANASLVVQGTR